MNQLEKLKDVLQYHRSQTPKHRRRGSTLFNKRYDIKNKEALRQQKSLFSKAIPNNPKNIKNKGGGIVKRRRRKKRMFSFIRTEKEKEKKPEKEEVKKKESLFGKIFFTNFSKLFNIGSKRPLKETDLFKLPKVTRCENLVSKFDELTVIHGVHLGRNLFRMVKRPMLYAIILKILEQGIGVFIPFMMAYFLEMIKKENNRDYLMIYGSIAMAVLATVLRSIFREHASKYTCAIMSRTGQTLRGIFYSHIMTANYSFLKNADTGFVAKMSIYEFDAITKFMGNIPNIASFPVTFCLVLFLIVSKVGSSSWILLLVFSVATLILAYLDHKMVKMNKKYKKIGSSRTLVLTEMLSDMRSVKINSWEVCFYDKLKKIRNKEIQVLNKLSIDKAYSNCLFFFTPILCSALIILLEFKKSNTTIDVGVAFAIVSVLNQLQKPLNILSSSVDLYIDFKIGHKSLSRFFRTISQKPQDFNFKPWLNLGEIRVFDCTGCLEDDIETHRKINKIFDIRLKKKRTTRKSNIILKIESKKKTEEPKTHRFTKSRAESRKTRTTSSQVKKEPDEKRNPTKDKNKEKVIQEIKKHDAKDYFRANSHVEPKTNNFNKLQTIQDEIQPLHKSQRKIDKKKLRKQFEKRSIGRFTRMNPLKRRKRKKQTFENSNITNLLQIIQSSKKLPQSEKIKEKVKSNLRIVHMDLTFFSKPGQKICLVGRPNSGCSELLLSISGETVITQGVCEVNGSISYIDLKSPFFINSASLKHNITLNAKFIFKRYQEILQVAGIDLKKFAGEDQVEVIENGRNFSNGERRKILLARFLYQDNDIYLFDHYFDEFETKQNLNHFHRVVKRFLKDKTVIYLSRKEEFVKEADYIYVFDNGSSVEDGTFEELMNSKKRYFKELLVKTNLNIDTQKASKFKSIVSKAVVTKLSNLANPKMTTGTKMGVLSFLKQAQLGNKKKEKKEVDAKMFANLFKAIGDIQRKKELGKVTCEKEEKVTQSLPFLTKTYLFILGKCRIFGLFLLFFITVMGFMTADIWLGIWSSKTLGLDFIDYFLVYGLICTTSSVFVILRDIIYHRILRKNSDSLHFKMLETFFNTSMIWFNKNPSSRVTFRMTRDQRIIDENLNQILQETFDSLIMVVGGLLILNVIYFGIMAIITLIIIYSLYRILKKFFKVTHSIAQMQAEKKAQLQAIYFRAMNESLHFRSLTMLDLLRDKFMLTTDTYQQLTTHLSFYSQRWLGMRLMWIQAFMVFSAFALPFVINEYFSQMYFKQKWQFALGIMWSIKIIGYTTKLVHSFSNTVLHMISVGRILNYLNHEDIENTVEEKKLLLPLDFDNDIEYPITIQSVSMRYGNLMVLKDISFRIRRKSRLAIFGTSGSGKHSLMNIIVGIFKIEKGGLNVFGRQIDQVLKREIRDLSFYVSQTPMLFAGSVRENIDPEFRFDDMALIKILAYVGFYDLIKINTATLKDLKEWEQLQNNPEKRLTMMLNLADFMAEAEMIKSRRSLKSRKNSSRYSKDHRQKKMNMYNHLYEGLVGDMLSDFKFSKKFQDTPMEKFVDKSLTGKEKFSRRSKRKASFSSKHFKKVQSCKGSKPELPTIKMSDRQDISSIDNELNEPSQMSEEDNSNLEIDLNPPKVDLKSRNYQKSYITVLKSKKPSMKSLQSKAEINQELPSVDYSEMQKMVKADGGNIMIHQVTNLPRIDDFSLETITDKSGEECEEYRTIKNFLNMKVLSKGSNIPWNMRKLIILAKAFVEEPYLLFFDENSLHMGYKNSFSKNFRKLKSNFINSMLIGFLESLRNINEFEEIILMEDGKVKEKGKVEDLVLDDNSVLSRKLKAEDSKLWFNLREAINEKNRDVSAFMGEFSIQNMSMDSGFSSEEEFMLQESQSLNNKRKSVVIEEELMNITDSVPGSRLRSRSISRKHRSVVVEEELMDITDSVPGSRVGRRNNIKQSKFISGSIADVPSDSSIQEEAVHQKIKKLDILQFPGNISKRDKAGFKSARPLINIENTEKMVKGSMSDRAPKPKKLEKLPLSRNSLIDEKLEKPLNEKSARNLKIALPFDLENIS